MVVFLDTNFLIEAQRPGTPSNQRFSQWLLGGDTFEISAMVWAEFLCGPLSPAEEAFARKVVPVCHAVTAPQAELAARLFDQTGRRSRSLADCIVAAGAILANAPLATENNADFVRFVPFGLQLA
jgi:predicted nucleic acid-binding protein